MHVKKSLLNNPPYEPPDAIEDISGSDFDANKAYQFRFKALYCDIYNLSIKAFNSSDEQLSFRNIFNINSIGEFPVNSSKANRQALFVTLRKFSPLSGLFDYVIFSEKSLIKDIGAYTGGWFSEELFISTSNLPDAVKDAYYSYAILAVNGVEPYTWNISSGNLPEGLNLDSASGVLSGFVEGDPAIYSFRVKVADDEGSDAEKDLILTVVK